MRSSRFWLGLAGLTLASGVAIALPWDIDMADSQSVKAYERPMKAPPEGVVAQDHVLTPKGFAPNFDRFTPEGQALANPYPADATHLALGEKMYGIYCTPCHGDGEKLGPVAEPGRFPGVVPLSGNGGVLKARTDGWVYLTIRNGGAIMPYYGWAMNDREMWSIVHYVRTLPNGAYVPPQPAAPQE